MSNQENERKRKTEKNMIDKRFRKPHKPLKSIEPITVAHI